MRVALFVTCLADTLYPQAGRATVELLERLGWRVDFPVAQTCFGQMHGNTGSRDEALGLARRSASVFEGAERVVSPSASCVGFVRELAPRLARDAGDEALAERLEALAPRVHELSELLCDVLGVDELGASFPHRVTYHPTCHSLRVLRTAQRPLRLLSAVHGIALMDLPQAEECCGFGGTFAVKNADVSLAML